MHELNANTVILYKGLEHPQFNSHGRTGTVVLELIL